MIELENLCKRYELFIGNLTIAYKQKRISANKYMALLGYILITNKVYDI